MPTYEELGHRYGGASVTRDRTRAVFGQVMGLVALTVGCAALGAYIGRNLTGGTGILLFIGAFACIFGLNAAAARGREQLAIGLLFGVGLLLGMAVGPVLAYYAHTNPSVLWQSAGATGAFVATLGAYGYATRRDLSFLARGLFWALIGLLILWHRPALRHDPARQHHLGGPRPDRVRRLHDLRLQPAAPHLDGRRGSDRGQHLPGRLQRVPVHAQPVRRR